MNGTDKNEDIMNININKDDEEDEHSPVKKRGGSSKPSTRRTSSKLHKIVSPQDNQLQTKPSLLILKKTAKFIDTYTYPHERIVLELAINLTKEDTFNKFAKGLGALLTTTQIVDPKFLINPIDPQSKEKDIAVKGNISTNMTKLGIHVQVSGNGYTFLKQKVWDKENQRKKSLKKKEDFRHPAVYFSIIISSLVDPKKIIE
jgi:hypothetical protein